MGSGLGLGTPFVPGTVTLAKRNSMNLNIPDLPLEDFEPVVEDFDEIKDESGGALIYGIVGAGQAGGRLAKAFYELGYKKVIVVNTAKKDLALLELPDKQKFHLDSLGTDGAGKDQSLGEKALRDREQEVFDLMRKVFGSNIDRILVLIGTAGGTGGGAAVKLVGLAKQYFSLLGKKDAASRVGVVAALPTTGEATSPKVAQNAFTKASELCEMTEKGEFAPLIIIDNDKISKLYPKLTVAQFWPSVNNTVAGLFHVFNILATQNSELTTFDRADYESIVGSSGCMILGVTSVKDLETDTGVSSALKSNLTKTLLAEGFDLRTAKSAAAIVVGNSEMFKTIPGLMDNIEYGFSTLASLTGKATVHRGIYEDDKKQKLVVYTMVSGLGRPEERLASLVRS